MENSSLQKTLQEIYSSQAFEALDQFQHSDTWDVMSYDEKEMLALLFIMRGETLLKTNQDESQRIFELACRIAPENPKVLCREALAYLSEPNDEQLILSACKAVEKAVALHPHFFDGWFVLGNALMTLGVCSQDSAHFYEADLKFQEARKYRLEQSQNERLFSWRWGLCWHFIAKQSGEAGDFRVAIEKYQQASKEGLAGTIFWNDYGNALIDLACLINRQEILLEAVDFYLKAIKETPDFFEGWFNLACSYQHLCEKWGQENFFQPAHMSFEKASLLNPEDATMWFRWAQLMTNRGKIQKDVDFIHNSFDKFEKAHIFYSDHPLILRDWAEAQMLVGSQFGNLELLHQAEKKILKSLELKPDHPKSWYIYGSCLNELGRYFSDEDYYCSAIEKFQYGISLSKEEPYLWYGLALAHFALGELLQDFEMLEKASRYCSRAIEFDGEMFPQFWNDWGVTLLKMGELSTQKDHVEAAIEKFEQAINRHQEAHQLATLDPQWLYNYGAALDYLGDFNDDEQYYEQAIQVFSQVLTLDSQFKPARYHLALALSHLGEMTAELECFYKACEIFQAIIGQDPEDDLTWNDWGVTLLHIAQLIQEPAQPELVHKCFQQAEQKLLQAALLGNVQAFYNLACLYSLNGNVEMSLRYLEKAAASEALPAFEDLMHDEWLDELRSTAEFRSFINELTIKLSKDKAL